MMEITICGRGGQGGVTLAKIIASAYFLKGKYVQAFGVYAAERSGAPLQAFVRVDDEEITNHNQVEHPDHIVVLDRTLIAAGMDASMKPGGFIIINTPADKTGFEEHFSGRKVATVDATSIAVAHGLGTRTVPIVNTVMAGSIARVLGLSVRPVEGDEAERLGLPASGCLLVTGVASGSVLEGEVVAGMGILQVDGKPVRTAAALESALSVSGRRLLLLRHQGRHLFVTILINPEEEESGARRRDN